MSCIPSLVWHKKYGMKYIDISLLPLRKKYRICSAFGLILFLTAILSFAEYIGIIEDTWIFIVAPTMFMKYSRVFFEPYYTSDIVSELDELCLYLRPFDLTAKNKSYWAYDYIGIPESLEKLLCGELNNKIAKTFCIGDPNTAVPTTISSSTIYASDAEWTSVVEELCSKSKVIVLRVMDTEGCIWELKHCVNKHINQTIFLLSDNKQLELLREYLDEKNLELPNIEIKKDKCIALYVDYEQNRWCQIVLNRKKDIQNLINNYINSHNNIKKEIQKRNMLKSLIKEPFKIKTNFEWSHCFSFLFQPFWYVIFNRWSKLWIGICVLYNLAFLILCFFIDNLIVALCAFIVAFIVWLWLAPRISIAKNFWGTEKLTKEGNIVLCKWVFVYMFFTILISLFIEYNSPKNYNVSDFVRSIMVDDYKYQNYVPLELNVDSAFTSIYTDENVRISLVDILFTSEDIEESEFRDKLITFYDAVSNVEDSNFCGWNITHRFSCQNEFGEYEENLCIVLADEKFTNYFVYSLDDNESFFNYFELKENIDFLLSFEEQENELDFYNN